MSTATPLQFLFVDAGVANIDSLLANVDPSIQVVRLTADEDGLTQIARALGGASNVEAVHIVSHGSVGALTLGSGTVDASSLDGHAAELATIRAALTDGADLLLYGCNVAEGASGQAFIEQLAAATGADVAASTDPTGSSMLGGDWDLEAHTGVITAAPAPLSNYDGLLGADGQLPSGLQGNGPWNWGGHTFQTKYNGDITDSDPENPLRAGNKWDRYVLSGVTAGTTVYVYMGNSSTVDDYLQIDRNGTIITQNDDGGDGERSYDAYVSWVYQPGDVIRATTFSPGYRGTYSLYIGTSSGAVPTPTDIGNAPAPAPAPATAPTFTDGFSLIATYNDTGATDTFTPTTGTLTASDTTPTGSLTFSNVTGAGTYGTLAVASNGSFVYTPNATVLNALGAGANVTDTFSVRVTDGGLATTKNITVNVVGANDAPTLSSDATIPAVIEDISSAANVGRSVTALFAPRFADVDTSASLGGIVIVGDASTSGQGAWQYSTDGGTTWLAVGAVTTAAGLALSASSLVRFAPTGDWNGTPGSLTIHAADNVYGGGFTSGATRVTFNTTNDAATSGVSVASRTISTSVTAVNDAPTFTSAIATHTVADTSSYNSTAFATANSVSGTLAGDDIDSSVGSLAFSIRGGALSSGTWTQTGRYGTLTLDATTHDWTYVPDKFVAINALAAGETAHDVFQFRVTDSAGASTLQAFDVTLTGTNDTPLVAAQIADQVFAGGGTWRYQVPAGSFTDAEGQGLDYTVEVLDGSSNFIENITATTAGNASLPSSWLTFDAATRTFSGNPPPSWGDQPVTLRVVATDPNGSQITDTFDLTLSGTGNQPPVVANPLSWQTVQNHHETFALQVGPAVHGSTIVFEGITATVPSLSMTGNAVANAVLGGSYAHWTATAGGGSDTVRFTSTTPGLVTDLTLSDFAGSFMSGSATLTRIVDGAASVAETGVRENFTLVLDYSYGGSTLIFDGKTYAITPNTLDTQVAQEILVQGGTTHWGVSAGLNPNEVVFTYLATGDQTDATINDFTGSVPTNGSFLLINNLVQGSGTPFVPAVAEVWDIQFATDEEGATVVFDGTTVTAGTPATAAEVVAAIVAAGATNYNVAADGNLPDVVVYTHVNPGVQTDVVAGDFTGTFGGATSVTTRQQGGWSYEIPSNTFSDPEGGTLTYTAWLIDGAGVATQITSIDGDTSLDFNPATRTLSGDGSALTGHTIEIRAEDPLGASASARFALNIDDGTSPVPLALGTAVDASGFVFDTGTHSFQLPADAFIYSELGGSLTYSATLDGGGVLPGWLSFDATTGVFSGNPPHGATSPSVTVTATDNHANSLTTAAFTLNVGTPNDPLVLVAPIADQAVAAGAAWSQNFSAPFSNPDGNADGTATSTTGITYTASANGQPLSDFGLSLTVEVNGSITFNGNPSAASPYLVIVLTGTENNGSTTASTSFTLSLNDVFTPNSLNANNPGAVTITGTPTEGQTLSVGSLTDSDGITGTPAYQWQVSADSGSTWQDISGSRGQGSTLALDESESGKQVRLQVLYNDNGGVAEAPVSNVVSVANLDTVGSVAINGIMTPGETLTATISDSDGITGATPTYQWYRGNTAITGATYSAYTLTNADGGANIRVDVSYTDDHSTVENRSFTTAGVVQLGVVAPVGVNDTGSLTEAYGVNNGTGGGDATGNLRANDTDVNNNIDATAPITGVRSGGVEGVGEDAVLASGTYTVAGLYGTLTVTRATGAWTYVLNQSNPAVDALFTGDTLVDSFNYTVADDTGLSDTAVLNVTINGANDSPTVTDIPTVAEFTEDVAEAIRTSFSLIDPDGGSGAFSLRLNVTQGSLRGENLQAVGGVSVTGTDTTTLTISAASMAQVQAWLTNSNLLYTSAPNQNGNLNATLTYSVSDDGGANFRVAGTTALNVASSNNPPVIDLGGVATTGNNFTTLFRPRGTEIAVVSDNLVISDIDPADTLTTATVTLTTGAFDNAFGTIYETLRSTAGSQYTGSLGQITFTGNGTTQVVLTGTGTHADYEAALKTIVYNNTNPNAFSGDRLVTISVSDADGAASNTASFATAVANNTIAVGQRIFLNGADTGFTVGQVIDNQHFVASGPLAGLAPGVTLEFWSSGAPVTTATQAGPVIATTTVQVPWTPVIDMNGDALSGRNHTVTYTEGAAAVAIATADASITDQDGNIASVVITLDNHPDASDERLTITSALVTQLANLGITVSGNNSHQITLTGNRDASFFQLGLRGVKYINSSENPDVTDRTVSVMSTDVANHTGVGAITTINIHSVNDAPSGSNATLTIVEDNAHTFVAGDFGFSDVEGNAFLAVTISTLPAAGSLRLDGVAVTAGQSITRADIDLGKLIYTPVAETNGSGVASFNFRVQDNGGTLYGGVDIDGTPNTITFNVTPVNDAPVLTAAAPVLTTITEDQPANAGQTIASLVGSGAGHTVVTDADSINNGGAGNSPEATGQGVAITTTTGSGGTWQFSTNAGSSWTNVGAVSTTAALLLRSTDLVRFVPDEVHGSTASFGFVAWDGATGTAGSTANVTTRGGSTAFSTASDTATITIDEVNDAPTGANNTLTVAEDGSYALAASEFGFTDIDGNAFVAVTISTLPASGTLLLDGVAVTAGQSVSVTDITAGKLVFHPAADASGTAQTGFGFKVQDDGGTARGGLAIDATERTVTFNVTPTNDAPVLTTAAPVLTTINENATANAGQLVSDFVGSGAGKTGVSDVDTLNNGGAGNSPEGVGQGIAIHHTANNGPASGGIWQYSTDSGSTWTAVGSVDTNSALLLRATDRIRFQPDAQNATEATFSYYAWDSATGSAGTKVDATGRGGATAFSLLGDTAAITVTAVNDAPVLDLNGGAGGIDYTAIFRPRGDAVAIVGSGVSITDADVLDSQTPDTISSATISLVAGDVDNQFGTDYETLTSTAGATYNGITITGNGTPTVTLTGIASRADYEAALRTIVYSNTNPNAFTGDRTIEITVRDTSVSTGNAGDRLDSAVATTTVQVPWTPVVDMNGDAAPGRNATVSFTERSAGVAIAAPDASIVDQDGNIQQVTITLTNPLDGSHEKLFISSQLVTQLSTVGITVTGNDTHTITLSGNRDGTAFQLGLRAIRYVNDSTAPSPTARVVSVESLDMQNNTGVGATTTINIVTINDAPVGSNSAVTLSEDTPRAFTVSDFNFSDPESHALGSVIVTTLPSAGSITLNGVAVTAGQEVSAADIAAGLLVYTPVLNANDVQSGVRSFTFQVRDAGGTANGGIDLDSSPNTLTLNITPVNDLPTGTVTTNAPSVTVTGNLREGQTLTANFDVADVDYTSGEILTATSYQWQTRTVPNGTWTNIAGATSNLRVLSSTDVNLEIRVVVSYVDTNTSTLTYTSDISARPAIVGDVNGDITLTLNTPDPVLIVDPTGDVTVTNTGNGPVTIDGAPDDGTITLTTDGPVTVSNPDGDISVVNNGPGTATITGLNDDATLTTGGNGPTTVSDPEGSLDLVNQGPGTVTVDGFNNGETLDVGGTGPTTVSNPDGDLSIVNAGPATVTVTGLNDDATLTTGGSGPTTVSDPEGSLDLVNQGPGTVTIGGFNSGETLDVSGSGPTTVADPDGNLAVVNAGPGTVTVTSLNDDATLTTGGSGPTTVANPDGDLAIVNAGPSVTTLTGLNDDATVTTSGNGPTTLSDPDGSLVLNNQGAGPVTVDGLNSNETLNVGGNGPTTVSNPDGNLTVANGGPGVVTVTSLNDDATLTTSGSGPTTVSNPDGSLTLANQGPGTVTVDGINAGEALNVGGNGPTTVSNPDGDVSIANAGPGRATVTGLNDDATLSTSGAGPVTVADPEGSLALANQGPGTVTVDGINDGEALNVSGNGPTTVSNPDGNVTIANAGPGRATVAGVNDDAVVTTSGNGPVTIEQPEGSLGLVNQGPGAVTVNGLPAGETLSASGAGPTRLDDPAGNLVVTNAGPGTVTVGGVNDGASVTTSGNGPITIDNPEGALALANAGPGTVTVSGVNDDQPVTITGSGPTRISAPDADVVLHLNGTGPTTVDGLASGASVTSDGNGPLVVDNPVGDVTLHHSGAGTATVSHLADDAVLTVDSSQPTLVSAPLGDVTVRNFGVGLVTTTGVSSGSTVTYAGTGPEALDLAGFPQGGQVSVANTAGANVSVLHAPDDATVNSAGSGDITITAPVGDLNIGNSGTGTVHVDQVADGATVSKAGSGPALIDNPAGSFTLANSGTGLVTLNHVDSGEAVVVQGTGPVAINSSLAAGERITVDTSGNSNVQLSNDGAGTIDVVGNLQLDAGDPMHLRLNGNGTTVLTVAGGVSLSGTPLDLQLDSAYAPHRGDNITLIANDGSDAITGTFAGLPEGAPIYLGGVLFRISYVGGTGNDVVLSRVNDAPTGAVTISGTPTQGQTLTASNSLADTDGLGTVRYQWMMNGALVAVGSTYVLTQAAVGQTISVVADYTDAEGTVETLTSEATTAVANINDAPTGSVLVSGTTILGQTLSATNTVADIDGMGAIVYQWQADGVDIAGAIGATHVLGRADIGHAITAKAIYTDGFGAVENVVSSATALVQDGNGVAPGVEAQVPGLGSGGVQGDGNGDGIQDSLQPSVVSASMTRAGSSTPSFVTLVVDSVNGKPATGTDARLIDFAQENTPTQLPSWAQAPLGQIDFTADVGTAGATRNFSLYVDANLGVNGYWAHNAAGTLVNLASAPYGGQMVVEGDKLRLDFQITEGGQFDAGAAGDTTIVSHGVAAHASLSLIGYTIDLPTPTTGNIWD